MTDSLFELVTLRGGSCSIRSKAHGETMHIGTDPRTEASELHVGQQRIAERAATWRGEGPFVIWDIGLGPAANALTAIEALSAVADTSPVEIHSFEIDTAVLEFALRHAEELGYLSGWEEVIARLLKDGVAFPLPRIRWQLHRGDFSRGELTAPAPCSVFFDPYSPARNAEMWSLETFRKLWRAVGSPGAPDCLMTNYTRSTAVRVTMALAGWFVGTGVATGEKNQTTIASNRLGLLERPLDRGWLTRVRSSTHASPLRSGRHAPGPISEEDFRTLSSLPQFS